MNGQNQNIKEIIISDLQKKGNELLVKHLDGRNYNESKVEMWIEAVLRDFENYFKEKYPNYYLFLFCTICSNNTSFYNNSFNIYKVLTEGGSFSVFRINNIYSCLFFFFFQNSIQINIFH